MKNTPFCILVLVVCLELGFAVNVAGEQSTQHSIVIKTDKSEYNECDTIFISGKIENFDPRFSTSSVRIRDPADNLSGISIVFQNDGTFRGTEIASSEFFRLTGEYTIIYQADIAPNPIVGYTTFFFNGGVSDCKVELEDKKLGIASFVDPTKDPQFYVDRYNKEPSYKKWFDENYPEYSSIYDAVELKNPATGVLELAKAQQHFGYIKQAFDNYEKALSLDPSNKEASKGKDETYNKIQEIEVNLAASIQIAEGYARDQDRITNPYGYDEFSYDKKDWINLSKADYYSQTGEYEQAKVYADKVNGNVNFDTISWLIGIYDALGDSEKVLELIDLTISDSHSDNKAYLGYLKVKALWKLEKYKDASMFVEDNSSYNTDSLLIDHGRREGDLEATNYLVKAIVFEKIGDLDTAKKYYESALNTEYDTTLKNNPEFFPVNMPPEQRKSYLYQSIVNNEQIVEGKAKFYQYVKDFGELEKMLKILPEERKNEIAQEIEYAKILNLYSKPPARDFSSSDIVCGTGTIEKNGQCVKDSNYKSAKPSLGGGCLIATATYGSELSPQVQQLRELRDNSLLQTASGTSFMSSFNDFYYSFSPTIADWERENPAFKEAVKITLTPMISSLSILNYVDMDSEVNVLGYGISLILLNVGMYFVAPAIVIHTIRKII